MEEKKLRLDVHEKPENILQWAGLSLQHVLAMIGATVLVPILTGLPIGVTLIASGVGTLIYILCTRGKVPVYLGSSFAYIAAIVTATTILPNGTKDFSAAYFGLICVGIVYIIVALVIKAVGKDWIDKLLPPVVVGPMIAIIGLGLAGVAINNAGLKGSIFDGANWITPLVAITTFLVTVIVSLKAHGFFKIAPFLSGIAAGYILFVILIAIFVTDAQAIYEVFGGDFVTLGLDNDFNIIVTGSDYSSGLDVMFTSFKNVKIFVIPDFDFSGVTDFNTDAMFIFIPLAFVTIAEHIGDHTVLSEVTGKDFLKDPGLDNTLLGDGIATLVSGAMGGPANTTYGENTGVVAMTKVASVWVIGTAALIAISLGFIGYFQAFVQTIPSGVIGGMSIILYGLIASNGIKVLVKGGVDMNSTRNIIVIATMLVIGLGGASIAFTDNVQLTGMSLAAIVGILLNLFLPYDNEEDEVVEA